KLSEAEQAQVATLDGAVALMLAYPNVIKRPVLWLGKKVVVGFDETVYQSLFQAA
ncbi:MAG: arsenate reductase, partial [Neisseriaceae bacterium]|nr:arsenate reductase [Neisseriaceae bacterium]